MLPEINLSALANSASEVGGKPLFFNTNVSSGAGDAVYGALRVIQYIAGDENSLSPQSWSPLLSALKVVTESGVQLPPETEQIFRLAHDRLVEIVQAKKGEGRAGSLERAPAVRFAGSPNFAELSQSRRVKVLEWGGLLGLIPKSTDPASALSNCFSDQQGRKYIATLGEAEGEMILALLQEMTWEDVISQFRPFASIVKERGLRDILVYGRNENLMGGLRFDKGDIEQIKAGNLSSRSGRRIRDRGQLLAGSTVQPGTIGPSEGDVLTPKAMILSDHNARVWEEAQQPGGIRFADDNGAALKVDADPAESNEFPPWASLGDPAEIIPVDTAANDGVYNLDEDHDSRSTIHDQRTTHFPWHLRSTQTEIVGRTFPAKTGRVLQLITRR